MRMVQQEIFNIVRIISAFLMILFSIFLLRQKNVNKLSFRFLAGFLLSRSFILIGMLMWSFGLVAVFPQAAFFGTPFLFLYSPMLYLYTLTVTIPRFQWKKTCLLHFCPFGLVSIILLFRYVLQDPVAMVEMLRNNSVFDPLPFSIISVGLWIQFLVYALGSLYQFYRYQQRVKLFFSTIEQLKLSWIQFLLLAFFVWKFIFLTGYLYQIMGGGPGYPIFQIFIEIGFLYYASMIVLKGLQVQPIFNGNDHVENKYRTSPLTDEDKARYLDKMESTMQDKKPYLNPSMTLADLSKLSSIPMHYMSQILNEVLNQRFYEYVNQYRIEESKRLLSHPSTKKHTILETLYKAGFNSKSVFNAAFKKHVGMTPSEYKKNHLPT